MEQQKFIEKIESIEIPCRYSLLCDEISTMYNNYIVTRRFFEGLMYAYNYGFKPGTNYGRKQNVSRRNLQKYANS